MMNKIS